MAHYAKVEDGIVTQVIVAEADFIAIMPGTYVQTSYNTRGGVHYDPHTGEPSADQSKALRFNYAGIRYTYDPARDGFIPPKPYASWELNETTCLWQAPVPMPQDGEMYAWDEDAGRWVKAAA